VLLFLTILTSGLQYLIQLINYRRDLGRVERIMEDARLAAWGPKMNPVEGKRKVSRVRSHIFFFVESNSFKVKVSLGGRHIDDEGNIIEGRTIDMVVEGQNVYIVSTVFHLRQDDTPAYFSCTARTYRRAPRVRRQRRHSAIPKFHVVLRVGCDALSKNQWRTFFSYLRF
jgi:DnaJ family protein C protein 1